MAKKFSGFSTSIVPDKTSTSQFIVGYSGQDNAQWTMKALADEIGGGGDSIYTANGTITDTTRTIDVPQNGNVSFVPSTPTGAFNFYVNSTKISSLGEILIPSGGRFKINSFNTELRRNFLKLYSSAGPCLNGTLAGFLTISNFGSADPSATYHINARLGVVGKSTTSTTDYAFRVQDSTPTDMLTVRDDGAIAIGKGAVIQSTVLPELSTVLGYGAKDRASAGNATISVAIGRLAEGNYYSVAVGANAKCIGNTSLALGTSAQANTDATVVGYAAGGSSTGASSVSLGKQAYAQNNFSVAIGRSAKTTADNAICLNATGSSATVSTDKTFGLYMSDATTPDFKVTANKGMIPPSITTTVRDAISSPESGSTIYNTTDNKLQFYNGTDWTDAGGGSGSSLWVEDAGNPGNISPSGGNNVDVGIGTTPVNGQRLIVRGSGTATTTAFKIEDSAGNQKLVVQDNGNVTLSGPAGYGGTSIKTYGNSGVAGTTFGNSSNQSFVVGLSGLGTTGSRFTIGAVPTINTAQFNLFTTSNGTGDAVQWKNSSSELLLDMKENGRTSFHGQVSVGLKSSAAIDGINWDDGNIQEVTLASGANDFDPTNEIPGSTYILKITQPSSADGTIDWESTTATVNWPGGTAPTLTATNAAIDVVTLVCTAANTYYGTSALNFS